MDRRSPTPARTCRRTTPHTLLALLAFLATVAPLPAAPPAAAPSAIPSAIPRAEPARKASPHDLALFYAGIPAPPGAPLKPWETSTAWERHAIASAENWNDAATGRHAIMTLWANTSLAPLLPPTPAIHYFFGGADFITPHLFFPNARTILLAGLEPIGATPEPATMDENLLRNSLDNLRSSMDGLLRLGFSETKAMRADLTRTPVSGVEPILLVQLARTGHRVLQITRTSAGSAPVLHIVYTRPSDGLKRDLYFIQGDLSDGGDRRILGFFSKFKPAGCFLKAASYLMHGEGFGRVRNFILENSSFLLQDDSGIPFRHFDGRWRIHLFGTYEGTMPLFSQYFQPDLRDAYRGRARPMPFGIGYRSRDDQAGQLLAVRMAAPN